MRNPLRQRVVFKEDSIEIQRNFLIKCIVTLIAFWSLSTTFRLIFGAMRELYRLDLDISDQLKHAKRQLFSHDLFEPVQVLHPPEYEFDFRNSSIVLVGMVRDQEESILTVLNQLDNLACLFAHAAIVIYESGSTDRTPQILADWKSRNNVDNALCAPYTNNTSHAPRIDKILLHPLLEPGQKYKNTSRLDRYSRFRDYMLNRVLQLDIEFDYLANVDLDILGIDIKGILHELHAAQQPTVNASVMCVNGMLRQGLFYDALAAVLANGSWVFSIDLIERTNIFHQGERFKQMISCFGGMAFYKFRDIIDTNCGYLVSTDAFEKFPELKQYQDPNPPGPLTIGICEHIPFHYCLHQQNKTIVIAKNAYLYYGYFH